MVGVRADSFAAGILSFLRAGQDGRDSFDRIRPRIAGRQCHRFGYVVRDADARRGHRRICRRLVRHECGVRARLAFICRLRALNRQRTFSQAAGARKSKAYSWQSTRHQRHDRRSALRQASPARICLLDGQACMGHGRRHPDSARSLRRENFSGGRQNRHGHRRAVYRARHWYGHWPNRRAALGRRDSQADAVRHRHCVFNRRSVLYRVRQFA